MSLRSALLPAWHSLPVYNQNVFTLGPSNLVELTSPGLLQGQAHALHLTISIFFLLGPDD